MTDDRARARVLALLRAYGWNATGFQVLERGFSYFFVGDDACVPYVDTGRAWVVAGAPIAAPERIGEVARVFAAEARRAGRRAYFFAVEQRFVDASKFSALLVGEQPTWDPRSWDDTLAAKKSLREQLRRGRAKGVQVRRVGAVEMRDAQSVARLGAEAVIARWLASRPMSPMGFLVGVQPFEFADERRYFVAERGGDVVGFLAAVPVYARSGWLFEDLVRDPRAPNGTSELLVDAAMRSVAGEGSAYVSLGLAPLAGPVHAWLARTRRWTALFYDFDGVRAFKAKLGARRADAILLAYEPDASPNAALFETLAAFAGGSFVGFGLRSLLRGPEVVVRFLAVALVVWTPLLAIAPGEWFPSSVVHQAWVGFDVVLAMGLLALSWRWRRDCALVLATTVTIDALVTLAEVLLYNAPRTHRIALALVLALSCAGPALGALTLWGAVRRHAVRDGVAPAT